MKRSTNERRNERRVVDFNVYREWSIPARLKPAPLVSVETGPYGPGTAPPGPDSGHHAMADRDPLSAIDALRPVVQVRFPFRHPLMRLSHASLLHKEFRGNGVRARDMASFKRFPYQVVSTYV